MNQRRFGVALLALVSSVLFVLLAPDVGAQDATVRIEGKVAWIAADKMVVAPPGSLPVTIDLSEVDLDEYKAVMSGDRVIVTGRPSPDGGRVVATSVQRLET